MITLLLGLITVMLAVILGGGTYCVYQANKYAEQVSNLAEDISDSFNNYFSSPGTDIPSPFIQFLDQVTEMAAQKVGVSTQAAIKGSLGGSMKGINAELEAEAAAADPSLAVVQALPKSLRKNPIALFGLQSLINKVMAGGLGQSGNNIPSNGNQARFSL